MTEMLFASRLETDQCKYYCKDSHITPGGYTKISNRFRGVICEGGYTRGGLYANLSTLVEKSEFSRL